MELQKFASGTHLQGESDSTLVRVPPAWPLDTPGGRFYAEWDVDVPVTREGQLIFFFQFLHLGSRWEQFMRDCPLIYQRNRESEAKNVMGTILLSVLNGHWRYAHINAVRGDGIGVMEPEPFFVVPANAGIQAAPALGSASAWTQHSLG